MQIRSLVLSDTDVGTFDDALAEALQGGTLKLDNRFMFASLTRLPLDDRGHVAMAVAEAAEKASTDVTALTAAERALLMLCIWRAPSTGGKP